MGVRNRSGSCKISGSESHLLGTKGLSNDTVDP